MFSKTELQIIKDNLEALLEVIPEAQDEVDPIIEKIRKGSKGLSKDVMTPDGPAELTKLEGLCAGRWTEAWVRFPNGVVRYYDPDNLTYA